MGNQVQRNKTVSLLRKASILEPQNVVFKEPIDLFGQAGREYRTFANKGIKMMVDVKERVVYAVSKFERFPQVACLPFELVEYWRVEAGDLHAEIVAQMVGIETPADESESRPKTQTVQRPVSKQTAKVKARKKRQQEREIVASAEEEAAAPTRGVELDDAEFGYVPDDSYDEEPVQA